MPIPSGSAPMDHLGLAEAVDGFCESVVIGISGAADGRVDTGFSQAPGVLDGGVLAAAVAMASRSRLHPALFCHASSPLHKNIPLSRNSEIPYIPAHPGSPLRGDRVVVLIASRACGGRGSVGREQSRAGRIALREPKASRGRTELLGLVSSCKFPALSTVSGKTAAKWRTVRTAKPCGPGRRCYGQALAEAAIASTGAGAGEFRESEGGQKELGSRESAA